MRSMWRGRCSLDAWREYWVFSPFFLFSYAVQIQTGLGLGEPLMQDLQRRTGGICHDWIRHECNSMKTPRCCCWGIVTFFTAISNVSGNAFMMFGRESDQQPTHSQYSTTSQGRRENSSTTSPPGTIETMRNILDTIIPTQVCSFLVILFLHLYKIPRLEVNHFWQNNFLRCATL